MTRSIWHHCLICHEDRLVTMVEDAGALFYQNEDDAFCCDRLMLDGPMETHDARVW